MVLVTGAAQGLGAACAVRAAALGAEALVLTDRSPQGQAVADQLGDAGPQTLFVPAELASEDDCRRVVRAGARRFGRLDGMVLSAGLSTRGTLETTTVALWDELFAVNVRAPFLLLQEAARVMDGGGSVVVIGSLAAHGGSAELMAYAATKAALATLAKNVAVQLQPARVRVNVLNLGWTLTEGEHAVQLATGQPEDWLGAAEASRPFGRLLRPADVAPMVTYLLSDAAGMVTGSVIDFDQTVHGPFHDPTVGRPQR